MDSSHDLTNNQKVEQMYIYRCNHCKIWGESTASPATCNQCNKAVTAYAPLQVINQLSARYAAALREIEALKNQDDDHENKETISSNHIAQIRLNDTDQLATEAQHKPLASWFAKQNIHTEFNYAAVDMSGYYDEAAEKNWAKLCVIGKIIRANRMVLQ